MLNFALFKSFCPDVLFFKEEERWIWNYANLLVGLLECIAFTGMASDKLWLGLYMLMYILEKNR